MMNKQGHQTAEDKTPAMGALPCKSENVLTAVGNSEEVINNMNMIDYYLVSDRTGKETEIVNFPFTIGRLSKDDLQIRKKEVSRSHAKIDLENNALVIINNSSLNGVRVNGCNIERVILDDGDVITIAGEKFIVKIEVHEQYDEKTGVKTSDNINDSVMLQNSVDNSCYEEENTGDISDDIFDNDTDYHSITETEVNKKSRYMLFSLAVIILLASSVLGYQYYDQYKQESRVFVVASDHTSVEKAVETSDNKAITSTERSGPDRQPARDNKEIVFDADKSVNMPKLLRKKNIIVTKKSPVVVKTKVLRKKDGVSEITKNTPLKRKILLGHKYSQKTIKKAKDLYFTGKYNDSITLLSSIEGNKRHQAEYRVSAQQFRHKIIELYSYYAKGNLAYEKKNKDEAFIQWVNLLNKHKTYFGKRKSYYTNKINTIVASEFETRGNKAYARQDWKKAYVNWKRSVSIRPKELVRKSISLMDAEIKQLYRTGYRYETVNVARAIEYWQALVDKAPSNHEYYIKASAKLRWYESIK